MFRLRFSFVLCAKFKNFFIQLLPGLEAEKILKFTVEKIGCDEVFFEVFSSQLCAIIAIET